MVFRNGFKEYALSGVLFGGIMGLMWIIVYGVIIGLISGIVSGVIFASLICLFTKIQEKKYSRQREEISRERRIICDGGATYSGNGGWMFFTEYGIEFYPHKLNISTAKIFIPTDRIADVSTKYNKMILTTVDGHRFEIVVSNSAGWCEQISACLRSKQSQPVEQ